MKFGKAAGEKCKCTTEEDAKDCIRKMLSFILEIGHIHLIVVILL